MKSFERGVEPLVVAYESAETSGPGEAAFNLNSSAACGSTKPRLAIGCLTTSEPDAMALRAALLPQSARCSLDRRKLHFDRKAYGHLLHVLSESAPRPGRDRPDRLGVTAQAKAGGPEGVDGNAM